MNLIYKESRLRAIKIDATFLRRHLPRRIRLERHRFEIVCRPVVRIRWKEFCLFGYWIEKRL